MKLSPPRPRSPSRYAEGGMGALYKGVGPRITRVMFEVAITMSLYGEVVKFLDRFDGSIF